MNINPNKIRANKRKNAMFSYFCTQAFSICSIVIQEEQMGGEIETNQIRQISTRPSLLGEQIKYSTFPSAIQVSSDSETNQTWGILAHTFASEI